VTGTRTRAAREGRVPARENLSESAALEPRVVLETGQTPDGDRLELTLEHGHHIIRVGGINLMSSQMRGSEEAMATYARREIPDIGAPRVLVGGLGMGFTLRAALATMGPGAEVWVAELLPAIVDFNRGVLAHLAGRPLDDPRVRLFVGDVRTKMEEGGWDAILLDVDNGPEAFTARDNDRLYSRRGVARFMSALSPGGVVVIWSVKPSRRFRDRLRRAGLGVRTVTVSGRWPNPKGPRHTLFVATRRHESRPQDPREGPPPPRARPRSRRPEGRR